MQFLGFDHGNSEGVKGNQGERILTLPSIISKKDIFSGDEVKVGNGDSRKDNMSWYDNYECGQVA